MSKAVLSTSPEYVSDNTTDQAASAAVQMMVRGESIRAAAAAVREPYERIRTLYHTVVVPRLQYIDWETRCKMAGSPALEAYRLHAAIKLDERCRKYKHGWKSLAADVLGMEPRELEWAGTILKRGGKHTIQGLESGLLSLFEALEISQLPPDLQVERVQEADKKVRTASEYLRVIVFTALDAKRKFDNVHPPVVVEESLEAELKPGNRREELMFAVNELIVWLDEMSRNLAEGGTANG